MLNKNFWIKNYILDASSVLLYILFLAKWGEWINQGKCSVTCGGGEQIETRSCFDHESEVVANNDCGTDVDDLRETRHVECNKILCRELIDSKLSSQWVKLRSLNSSSLF